ncbi:ATP-binding protein [Bacillus salacetis]|uniref:ATP-binding protein n=1 Tax=Bacillus salacetis TaxID=2315464 RepID=UPI003B9FC343
MEFVLVLAVALIPLIISVSLLIYYKTAVSRALSLFLLLLCCWQIDISVLYAHKLFQLSTIDFLFRVFRTGSILMTPLIYFFCYNIVRENPAMHAFKRIFNKAGVVLVIAFSTGVYLVNFTSMGIREYRLVPEEMWAPSHLMPVYGPLHFTYIINIVIVCLFAAALLLLSLKMEDQFYRSFYKKLAVGEAFVLINGIISGFGVLPLYFSSLNSIIVAIALFLGFFQMQARRLNTANQNLARQSSLMEEIMNINPNFITVLNRNNQIIKMNEAMESLVSVPADDLLGKDVTVLQRSPNQLDMTSDKLQRINRRTGETLYVQWGYKTLKHREKETYTLVFGIDYTNQKRNEQLLLSSEKSKVIGELAASIAHEIRNPLTTIRGFIQLLKEKDPESQYEDIILEEIVRIDEVLSEMLLLAKPEARDEEEKKNVQIDVIKELANIKMLFDAVALEQNKQLTLEDKLGDSPDAYFNPSHFKQVILNILKNSFEATKEKDEVKLKVDEKEGCIRIRIIDNGKGISKERLSRIGEPYFTNKEKGTGIGLTICFKLIKDYSGEMKVLSKVGWGTVTTILLAPDVSRECTVQVV